MRAKGGLAGRPFFTTPVKRAAATLAEQASQGDALHGGHLRILLVEDEPVLAGAIVSFLRRGAGYSVDLARDGSEALVMFENESYSVAILDWNLPTSGPSGLELCRLLRARASRLGVLFVTAREAIDDKVLAFDAGADDYLVKPFEPRELLARVKALGLRSPVLRRGERTSGQAANVLQPIQLSVGSRAVLEYDIIVVDLVGQIVSVGAREIELPKRQFLLLVCLLKDLGHTVSERDLHDRVLRTAFRGRSSTIRNLIGELRHRIGRAGKLIQTVRGRGYGIGLSTGRSVRKK